MINFGGTIQKYRKQNNFTQEELAKKIDVTSTYLSAVENNRKEPSIQLLNVICETLKLPQEILFWDSVEISGEMKKKDKEVITLAKEIVQSYFSANQ